MIYKVVLRIFFFMFCIAVPALLSAQPKPGGVSSNLVLWLKADGGVYSDRSGAQAGATAATSGDAVQSWADVSGARTNDATGINETDVPIYYNNEIYNLNYN